MYYNRFDICGAWHIFCCRWYPGGGSFLYRKLSQLTRIEYRPGLCVQHHRFETENMRSIYLDLLRRMRRGEVTL